MKPLRNSGDTVDRLRADIDAGRTRDKVAAADPAAAPLGADEEAAGTPLQPAVVSLARRQEVGRGDGRRKSYGPPIVAAVTLLVAMVGLALLFIRAVSGG
jgi:hypothetical protein